MFIGDGIMNIIHKIIFYQEDTTIKVDTVNSILEWVLTIAVGIVAVAVIAATIHFAGPAVIAAVTKLGWASFAAFLKGVGVGTVIKIAVGGGVVAAAVFNREILPDKIYFPVYQISPEEIVSNEILLFDVDFFNPKEDKLLVNKDGKPIDKEGNIITDVNKYVYLESTAKQFRTIISNAYNALRNIALVSLLSILVYVGIRILLSSVSSDKAKYKKMLIDWIVAFCLLFFMQYIMSFTNLMIGKVTDILNTSKGEYTALIPEKNGKVEEVLKKMGYNVDEIKMNIDGETYFNWKTNSLGVARLNAQMAKTENASYAGYTIVFVSLVLLTVYFIWTYLWRVCKMVFYTVFSPIISVIYPMRKQVSTDWFKAYMSTLAIQPIHLLLCYILIYQNFELSSTNILYYIVSIVDRKSVV